MKNQFSKFTEIILMVYMLFNFCDNNLIPKMEIPYKINSNSIEYTGGLLTVIGMNEENVHVGAKSIVFKIPFNSNKEIEPYIYWKTYISRNPRYQPDPMYIRFMSQLDPSQSSIIEICGSDNQRFLECRAYNIANQTVLSRHTAKDMIPLRISGFSSKHIYVGSHIVSALHNNYGRAYIALHYNRSVTHHPGSPLVTPPSSFSYGKVNFLQISKFKDKIYFIFTETASEFVNYHNAFFDKYKPKIPFTRIGRVCLEDKHLDHSFFTSFIKSTLNCQLLLEQTQYSLKNFIVYTHAVGASEIDEHSGQFLIMFRSSDPINNSNMYSSVFCRYSLINIEKELERSKFAVLKRVNYTEFWIRNYYSNWFPLNLSNCLNSSEDFSSYNEALVLNRLKPIQSPLLIDFSQTIGNPTTFRIIKSIPMTIKMKENQSIFTNIDLVFIGTDRGFVAKGSLFDNMTIERLRNNNIFNLSLKDSIVKFHHSINVFNENISINDIKINIYTNSIIVTSDSIVRRISLEFCSMDCSSCNTSPDPMCQWNPKTQICEIKPLSRQMNIIQLYNCQSDMPFRSRNKQKEKTVDYFWLIFSIVTFFNVFSVVLTVSIIIRYSSVSFPGPSRRTRSTIYRIVKSEERNKSVRKEKAVCSSIVSSLSDISPTKYFTMRSFKKRFNFQNSTKESLIYENRVYINSRHKPKDKSKVYSYKRNEIKEMHFLSDSKNIPLLHNWKSCDAIFQIGTQL